MGYSKYGGFGGSDIGADELMKPKIVMVVTNDEFELPMASGTVREIATNFKVRIRTIHNASRNKTPFIYRAFGKVHKARVITLKEGEY